MNRVSSLSFLAVLASMAGAWAQTQSVDTITVSATVTVAGTATTSDNGKVATVKQALTSYRIGNRELLQAMVDANLITSVTGYALVELYNNDGTPGGFYAWNASTHSMVGAPDDVFGFVAAGSVSALNKTTKQPTTTGGTVTTTSTVNSVSVRTVNVDGANCSLMEKTTAITPTTGKIGTTSYTYTGVTSKGTLQGLFSATGPAVSGTLNAASPKPFLAP